MSYLKNMKMVITSFCRVRQYSHPKYENMSLLDKSAGQFVEYTYLYCIVHGKLALFFFETNMKETIIAVNLKFHIHTITFGRVTVATYTGCTFPSNRIQWGKHLFLHAKTWRNINKKKQFQREHTSIAQHGALRTNLILPNCRAYTPKLHLKLHLRLQLSEPKILNCLLYWFVSIMYQSQNIYKVSTQSFFFFFFLQNQLLFWFSRLEFNSMTSMLLVSYSFQFSQRECFCIKELKSAEVSCEIIHGIFFCSHHDHNF